MQEKVRSCEFFTSQDSHNRTFLCSGDAFPEANRAAKAEAIRRDLSGTRALRSPPQARLRMRPPDTSRRHTLRAHLTNAPSENARENGRDDVSVPARARPNDAGGARASGQATFARRFGQPRAAAQLVDVVKLGARENGKVEAVDAQGIALAGIMGSLLRRAMRIVPVVFQHNSLSGPKPIAHHAAQSRGRPRTIGQCDRFVQKRRSQAQPSLGKQGERNDGYLGLHERPRLGKHLLRRRSGHLHARQTLCTGGKSRKAPR